ncbi:MAG: CD225/dispanin family protein [Armatimonadota bacterium]
MFCRRCGTQNEDNAKRCVRCGDPLIPAPEQQPGQPFGQQPGPLTQPPGQPLTQQPGQPSGQYNQQPGQYPNQQPGQYPGQYPGQRPYQRPAAPPPNVPNHLAESIVVTLFCCLITGIVAIIYSTQVNSKLQQGDYAGAVDSSNKAKTWSWVSFGLGLVGIVIRIILMAAKGAVPRPGY